MNKDRMAKMKKGLRGVVCDKKIPMKLKGRVYCIGSYTSFILWCGVLAYRKVSHTENAGCRNGNDSLDVWPHET